VALLIALATFVAGCDGEDVNHLARVGNKVAEKAQFLSIGGDTKLGRGWQAVRNGWDETTLEARVGMRLRWDKNLSDTKIEVTSADGIVELRGAVRNSTQRQRAIELAEATAGVEQVIDALEEPAADP
jgi:osmotically-inducible protein OsmY